MCFFFVFVFVSENRLWHFKQIVTFHEIAKPTFLKTKQNKKKKKTKKKKQKKTKETYFKMSSAGFAQRMVKVKVES